MNAMKAFQVTIFGCQMLEHLLPHVRQLVAEQVLVQVDLGRGRRPSERGEAAGHLSFGLEIRLVVQPAATARDQCVDGVVARAALQRQHGMRARRP
jgi:hypothetical protein